MWRRIFTILSALSLLLCVTTGVLFFKTPSWWVMGYPDFVLWGMFAAGSVPLMMRRSEESNRRLFTILSIASLILGLVACWESGHQRKVCTWHRTDDLKWPNLDFDAGTYDLSTTRIRSRSFALMEFVEIHGCYQYERTIGLPWWLTIGLLSIMPILWLRLRAPEWYRRHQDRLRAIATENNRCVSCGYDLRATPERCPECGTVRD